GTRRRRRPSASSSAAASASGLSRFSIRRSPPQPKAAIEEERDPAQARASSVASDDLARSRTPDARRLSGAMIEPAATVRARRSLRVLLVEDSEMDAELLMHELTRTYEVTATRVCTADAMRTALESEAWDIVLSDYSMPGFTAPDALAILRASGRDLPFIIVSGTIGEETAVTALKAGAADFLVKGRRPGLGPAIERKLRDSDLRRKSLAAQQAREDQLRQAQKREAMGQPAGGVPHDFNNMRTAILGYAELLTVQIGPEKPIGKDL